MNYYSKSIYVKYCNCHKRLWLEKYKPEYMIPKDKTNQLINGNIVGDLAMGLFGDYYLAETQDNNLQKMVENTLAAIDRNEKVICEAAFFYKNNYCAVDILKKDEVGYSIYEVKSTASLKAYYSDDISYQYYILKSLGYNINTINVIYINSDYIYDGKLELNSFFKIEDLTNIAKNKFKEVNNNLNDLDYILNHKEEPESIYTSHCKEYDGCPFANYCYKCLGIPEEGSVLNLYRNISKAKQIKNNIITFEDLLKNNVKLTDIQKRQIEFFNLKKDNYYLEKDNIKTFLSKFDFPLYFFDFETYQAVVPDIINTRPYQQIPFQYSLHILDKNNNLIHKEFLGDGINNPTLPLVRQMIEDLGQFGSIIAYNDSFEKSRIKELAHMYPNYANELYSLLDRFIDLAIPFQKGYCYNRAMGGSFSIKSVLPALFPNDSELNYHNLEQIHRGDEANAAYLNLKNMNKDDYDRTRINLLNYCCLDTYAMVKIYLKLIEFVND
ncbi:MAG: DUF2779 domain-containing protein [Anaeroplasma sp.]